MDDHRIEEFRASGKAEYEAAVKAFVQRHGDFAFLRKGLVLEYDAEMDHLYITVGDSPRDGVAMIIGDFVFLQDPNTREVVGAEILFFMERVRSGRLAAWRNIAELLQTKPVLRIMSAEEMASISQQMNRELAGAAGA